MTLDSLGLALGSLPVLPVHPMTLPQPEASQSFEAMLLQVAIEDVPTFPIQLPVNSEDALPPSDGRFASIPQDDPLPTEVGLPTTVLPSVVLDKPSNSKLLSLLKEDTVDDLRQNADDPPSIADDPTVNEAPPSNDLRPWPEGMQRLETWAPPPSLAVPHVHTQPSAIGPLRTPNPQPEVPTAVGLVEQDPLRPTPDLRLASLSPSPQNAFEIEVRLTRSAAKQLLPQHATREYVGEPITAPVADGTTDQVAPEHPSTPKQEVSSPHEPLDRPVENYKAIATIEPISTNSQTDGNSSDTRSSNGEMPQPLNRTTSNEINSLNTAPSQQDTASASKWRLDDIQHLRFEAERQLAEAPLRTVRLQVGEGRHAVEVSLVNKPRGIEIAAKVSDPELTASLRRELPALSTNLTNNGYDVRIGHPNQDQIPAPPASVSAQFDERNRDTGEGTARERQRNKKNQPASQGSAGRKRGQS
ncbi:hypothetical protein F183_A43440 [Bryobacterales bacterium F-183]|nr:hypothetical protein F183_A43440 [Bryobacterales bacterium F-183]